MRSSCVSFERICVSGFLEDGGVQRGVLVRSRGLAARCPRIQEEMEKWYTATTTRRAYEIDSAVDG